MTLLIIPSLQRSWKGGILVSPFPSVRPSICPSVDRILSALYLQQYLPDPFLMYTSYQATSECVLQVMVLLKFKNWNFGKFFKFVTWTFLLLTWDPIWLNSMGNIMRWRGWGWGWGEEGVSSERRCSSSSSFIFLQSHHLTHRTTQWGRDKMAAISLSNTFSWMKMLEFWLKFVPKGVKPLSKWIMTVHQSQPKWTQFSEKNIKTFSLQSCCPVF